MRAEEPVVFSDLDGAGEAFAPPNTQNELLMWKSSVLYCAPESLATIPYTLYMA